MSATFLIEVNDKNQAVTPEGAENLVMCLAKPAKYYCLMCTLNELPFIIGHLSLWYCRHFTVNGTEEFTKEFNKLIESKEQEPEEQQ